MIAPPFEIQCGGVIVHESAAGRARTLYNVSLRRALAILLLFAFSVPLIPLTVSAHDAAPQLPACCRKDGKHGCSMKGMTDPGKQSSRASIKSPSRCASFPTAVFVTAGGKAVAPPASSGIAPEIFEPFSAAEQAETHWRISFSRAWQKRGPPPSLLS
jgi:hypothetical protein